ncbi:MAG TPA: ankyrin repeat domain-containing protein [Polyangiaceae bacterium]
MAGGQVEALEILFEHAGMPLVGSARALDSAARAESAAMVRLLLDHGANATGVKAGRWVLHAEIAPLLTAAGARIDRSADWIRLSCTGNQGRKDDPDYVQALLRHGARANDRRRLGVTATGATALHYAAKAGFLKTIEVLLEHGADPLARDDHGKTPLDWLSRASKSVDQQKCGRCSMESGAISAPSPRERWSDRLELQAHLSRDAPHEDLSRQPPLIGSRCLSPAGLVCTSATVGFHRAGLQ